jgi:hypothetical protein
MLLFDEKMLGEKLPGNNVAERCWEKGRPETQGGSLLREGKRYVFGLEQVGRREKYHLK